MSNKPNKSSVQNWKILFLRIDWNIWADSNIKHCTNLYMYLTVLLHILKGKSAGRNNVNYYTTSTKTSHVTSLIFYAVIF